MSSVPWAELCERYPGEALQELLLELARAALEMRDLRLVTFESVGHLRFEHFQAIKFRCETESGPLLVCLYVPNEDLATLTSTPAIAAPYLWLEALSQESDMVVQTPLRDGNGGLLSQVEYSGVVTALCSTVKWLPGRPLDDGDESPLPSRIVRDMGSLLGLLHVHSSGWDLPPELAAPPRESEQLDVLVRRLTEMSEGGAVPSWAAKEAEDALLKRKRVSQTLERQTGLLHGDFHAGNVLIDSDTLYPIDFGSCCQGEFAADLAWCMLMQEFDPERVEELLAGYTSVCKVPSHFIAGIEGQVIQEALWFVTSRRGLEAKVADLVEVEVRSYLRDDSFLFNDDRTWL